jgi:diguanylate cyclase (GGDEF)-like protein
MSGEGPDTEADQRIRVLLIEDDPADAKWIEEILAQASEVLFETSHAQSLEHGLRLLRDGDFQCTLLDLSLEEGEGLDTLARAKVAASAVPIIAMTSLDDEVLALQALRFGAQDYLVKGDSDARLVRRTVRHAVERHRILADLAQARQQEHYLATHDALTGLPNRLAFQEQLRRTLAYSARSEKEVGVLFLDVDRFKNINDSLGHPTGDELLRIVSERIRGILRSSDMVARLGGDEFVMMLQDVQREHDPGRVAQKLTDALGAPCVLEGREYRITASIGIAIYPRDGVDHDTLIRNADTAMYHAKAEGLNRFSYYSAAMNSVVSRRLDLENGLRSALERDCFLLNYQPQIDLDGGALCGVEALLRWSDTERGSVGPTEFIPIAEETGLIHPIGEWVLRTACREGVQWQEGPGRGLKIGVNVSTRQLADPSFALVVARALRDSGLEPTRLELEITESSVLQERGVTLSTVRRIQDLGVRIAIDDFGTGYSALSALKHLPVSTIKLDRSFVRDIPNRGPDMTITGGLIGIARELDVQVVAEGVENRNQRDVLFERGCTRMQGFLFGRPIPAAELESELARRLPSWTRGVGGD